MLWQRLNLIVYILFLRTLPCAVRVQAEGHTSQKKIGCFGDVAPTTISVKKLHAPSALTQGHSIILIEHTLNLISNLSSNSF